MVGYRDRCIKKCRVVVRNRGLNQIYGGALRDKVGQTEMGAWSDEEDWSDIEELCQK